MFFIDYAHIFTDGSKDGKKTVRLFFVHHLSSQNVYRTSHQFLQLSRGNSVCIALYTEYYDSKSALQSLLSKWDQPTVQIIMRFFYFHSYCT